MACYVGGLRSPSASLKFAFDGRRQCAMLLLEIENERLRFGHSCYFSVRAQ